MSLRSVAKGAVERGATSLGAAKLAERANRRAFAILSYHNVVPDGEPVAGDSSLHLPASAFRAHLDELESRYEIVALERVVEPADGDAPRVAITFDDAYAGAVEAGVGELARRGLPATIFVPAGMLGRRTFWWDRLADETGRIPADRRKHVLRELAGADEAVRGWMAAEGIAEQALPEHATTATADELARVAGAGTMTLGAHGWGHLNLVALDGAALEEELTRPAETLRRDHPSYRPWLAYPYGSTSAAVEAAARDHYVFAFRIDGGLTRAGDPERRPGSLPRINVPAGLSHRGLRLRVAGMRP